MGSFLSLSNNNYNKSDPDVPKGGEVYTLTTPTTITDTLNLYNIPSKINNELDNLSKDINTGLTHSYNTITTSTDDIFMSINKGLKNLLDLSADSIDYFADSIGLYKNEYSKSPNSTTTTSSDINNLSETTKEKLLNETTSFNETTNLNENISSDNISTTEIINNLSETTKEKLLNETTSLNENMLSSEDKIFLNENEDKIISSEDNDLSKINDYIISPTSYNEEKNNKNEEEKNNKNEEEKIEKQLSSINEVKNKQLLSSSYNYTSTDKLTTLNMADNSMNLSRF